MIYHENEHGTLYCGDSIDVLKSLADESIDSIVTDPPYGLSFMGKKWDYDVPSTELWAECLRVLKPGGHLLAFAGTRTQHRMAVRIEDAGFEIRDMIAWVYGSGFPKSLDVGKAIDKMQGNERINLGLSPNRRLSHERGNIWKHTLPNSMQYTVSMGSSPYEGYGTALKPALEPITVARKPIEGTVAENVLKWGTGGINIDGCRVGSEEMPMQVRGKSDPRWHTCVEGGITPARQGRFPANLIHDGSDEVLELFPETSKSTSAARFFYCAKASRKERDIGLSNMTPQIRSDRKNIDSIGADNPRNRSSTPKRNHHPTVKPIALMQYLLKLVTPVNGITLDPFAGSGSTQCAAIREGFSYIGIDISEEYCEIAVRRIEAELDQTTIDL